ncbi:hypothetical protein CY34DRAFT_108927 [Suillus luteus UH-Slu-Lm8-n1]|uniref:Uncharacterized protein n=1 Tax=Suillus luteus UH-Slu-Lm8-n1 TaxID=930992 RepID=A0A0D0AU46_9AGAM|nr:hypothetical protein CY34DRAFT_108927 [Suillus luteus UH-Slu-Lm8-n1]
MSSDADTDTSIDSRSSDFNDGAEAILKNTTSETRTAGKGVHCSRSATPQSHKDSCPGPGQSHGQGGPVYSCGCYAYNLEHFTDRYQMGRGEDGELCLKQKRSQYDWYNAMNSVDQDITNGEKAFQKHTKHTRRFKYLANKVKDMEEAMSRLEAAIGRQCTILKEVCEAKLSENGADLGVLWRAS